MHVHGCGVVVAQWPTLVAITRLPGFDSQWPPCSEVVGGMIPDVL